MVKGYRISNFKKSWFPIYIFNWWEEDEQLGRHILLHSNLLSLGRIGSCSPVICGSRQHEKEFFMYLNIKRDSWLLPLYSILQMCIHTHAHTHTEVILMNYITGGCIKNSLHIWCSPSFPLNVIPQSNISHFLTKRLLCKIWSLGKRVGLKVN